ncbi:MAG TPA: ROK family protein [Chthoniobacterales bacterium]|jgi:Transcriptional regulator/sugar kinase|nr:ROK family protein [Chthoniobacterales bacterium]
MKKRILVIDVGGSNVKLMISRAKRRKFKSGPKLTPREMISQIRFEIEGWKFDAISVGFPAPVRDGRILAEPKHLGKGWVRFDFEKAFRKPVRVVNDAALQALGSYRGGRMLFLGLGTGLGSTLVLRDIVIPLELGDLPYCDDWIIEDFLGKPGLDELGEKEWQYQTMQSVVQLKKALIADYVVLGGGNAKKLKALPEGAELGHNRNAFLGGARLWQIDPRTRRPKWKIM